MVRTAGTLLMALVMLGSPAFGESAARMDGDVGLTAMHELSFLVGDWNGSGWMQRGPERTTFSSRETVESRLDGRVLVVEGLHHAPDGTVVHHALATVSHDAENDRYHFRSHLSDGRGGDHAGALVDGAFVWGFETERGHVRYTIHVENDEWHEVGEFSSDGESWRPFFQMDLVREGA